MISLGSHFSHVSRRNSERAHQQRWFIKARENHQKHEEMADKLEDDAIALAVEVIMATEQQIYDFEVKLDQYDAATVTALMENQKQLDAVNAQIEDMLSRAYVMEDGRRVFKTIDGTQVFDEFREEVSRDELDFDLIGDDLPKWELYDEDFKLREKLELKKDEILKFQNKVDTFHEKAAKGGLTEKDIEEMEADLEEFAPEEVKVHMPGYKKSTVSHDATVTSKTEVTTPEVQASIPTPM